MRRRFRRWWSAMSVRQRRGLLCDVVGIVGLVLLTIGAAEAYGPLGWLVPGLVCCSLAAIGASRRPAREPGADG